MHTEPSSYGSVGSDTQNVFSKCYSKLFGNLYVVILYPILWNNITRSELYVILIHIYIDLNEISNLLFMRD
jgi:hypothetical protein